MLDQLIEDRKRKLQKLRDAGVDPYPAKTPRTTTIAALRQDFARLARAKKKVSVAGRVAGLRDQGGVIFLDIRDESGQVQAVLNKKTLKDFKLFKATLDSGDFVSVAGRPFKTKKGEQSIEAGAVTMLAKSLRPMPGDWYGLADTEIRQRLRYLELNLQPEMREMFRKKSVFWQTFRQGMFDADFTEVELPVLEHTPGGAEAEPFTTHHNALDQDFYLRISLELPLKKLLVGGYEKVFEIGRIFRNEGISKEHLQDYTQLEFYWAYADYDELMKFVEKLYKKVIKATMGTLTTVRDGKKINWGRKWPRVDYVATFKKETGLDPLAASREELVAKTKALKLEVEPGMGKGRLIDLIYKKTVRPKLIQPCFLVDPPVEIEPLAKRSRKDPRRVERFQIMAGGTELGKGFSELNDPADQRARFEEQERARAAGDKEAQQMDEDYLEALEYGMPPAAGFGVSERLFAVLMDKPIRETVFFPLMRPKDQPPTS
jgi:lysyl-tRNA synthetase class 2